MIYLLYVNSKKTEAVMFYSLLKNEMNLKLFMSILLQRSVFNHFVSWKENLKESKSIVNIFKKRNNAEDDVDTKKIDEIILLLKKTIGDFTRFKFQNLYVIITRMQDTIITEPRQSAKNKRKQRT